MSLWNCLYHQQLGFTELIESFPELLSHGDPSVTPSHHHSRMGSSLAASSYSCCHWCASSLRSLVNRLLNFCLIICREGPSLLPLRGHPRPHEQRILAYQRIHAALTWTISCENCHVRLQTWCSATIPHPEPDILAEPSAISHCTRRCCRCIPSGVGDDFNAVPGTSFRCQV